MHCEMAHNSLLELPGCWECLNLPSVTRCLAWRLRLTMSYLYAMGDYTTRSKSTSALWCRSWCFADGPEWVARRRFWPTKKQTAVYALRGEPLDSKNMSLVLDVIKYTSLHVQLVFKYYFNKDIKRQRRYQEVDFLICYDETMRPDFKKIPLFEDEVVLVTEKNTLIFVRHWPCETFSINSMRWYRRLKWWRLPHASWLIACLLIWILRYSQCLS